MGDNSQYAIISIAIISDTMRNDAKFINSLYWEVGTKMQQN